MKTILIVEDDLDLSDGLSLALAHDATEVIARSSIAMARQQLAQKPLDLILLDINLPDGSGLDFLCEIKKQQNTPVILLTAKDTEMDIVTGFDQGADDYIVKPFSLAILRARVQAQLRRETIKPHLFNQPPYVFDFEKMIFTWAGNPVELSKTEQKLLRLLVEDCGITLTREILLERVWDAGGDFVDENTLSVAIKRLRDKLNAQEVLKTVYGVGYSWEKSQ